MVTVKWIIALPRAPQLPVKQDGELMIMIMPTA